MKAEWLQLMRIRAAGSEVLIAEPDLISQLYRWRDYSGSLDEPREWVAKAIRTDEGFASMTAHMISRGTRHSIGDRTSTPYNRFNRDTIEDFIGIAVAKSRCDTIDYAEFPEHKAPLEMLQSSLEVWLGLRARDPFDF